MEDVGRDEIKRLLSESMFNCLISELTDEDALELDMYTSLLEKEMGITFPQQTVGTLPPLMRLHYDPVPAYPKPLLYYTSIVGIDKWCNIILWSLGFVRKRAGAVTYWILESDHDRNALKSSADMPPVTFVHGVGVGLMTYVTFIVSLTYAYPLGSRPPLILVELPHVSMKLNVEVIPSMPKVVEGISMMLQENNFRQSIFVGHSLGSFVLAAVLYRAPSLIAGMVLVDPVCFKLWEPKVMSNFCYRKPANVMQILMHYLVTHELTISHYFHRHFIWTDCVMFVEDIPAHTSVILSELDEIIDAPGIMQHFRQEDTKHCVSCEKHIALQTLHGRHHGEWNVHWASLRDVLRTVVSVTDDLISCRNGGRSHE